MTRKLLVATHNPGKVREYRELLIGLPVEVTYLDAEGIALEVEETGETLAENAAQKATAYARASGLWTWADDSGLEVDALGGRPGVRSARYAGAPALHGAAGAGGASDADRYRKLLDALAGVPWARRTARFRCTVAIAIPRADARPDVDPRQGTEPGRASEVPGTWRGDIYTADGVCEGIIAFGPAGSHGFGYDPVFYLPEYGATMAQLPAEVKNQISHRGRAAREAVGILEELLQIATGNSLPPAPRRLVVRA
jgi:XTP/dITP diphosphohydrolase